jgi:hypothetical protein
VHSFSFVWVLHEGNSVEEASHQDGHNNQGDQLASQSSLLSLNLLHLGLVVVFHFEVIYSDKIVIEDRLAS